MKDSTAGWVYSGQSKVFSLLTLGLFILCLAGLVAWRSQKRQPVSAGEVLNLTLGCSLLYNLVQLAQAWRYYPTTVFPPWAFEAWCLPGYGVFFSLAGLLLPGRLRISLLGLWLSLSSIWLLCNVAIWSRPGEIVAFEGEANSPQHLRGDPRLGFVPVPNADVRACKKIGGQVIYDVRYRHDAVGRRKTPIVKSATRSLLCFGCSFTYGEGVNDEETWPAALSREHPGTQTFNYGCSGWGPAQMLDQIAVRKLTGEVGPAPCQAVYLYLPDHQRRVMGSWQFDATWGATLSRYRLRNGQAERLGPMATTQSPLQFLLSRTLQGSGFLAALRMDRPLRYTAKDFDLIAELFAESQRELESQVGKCPVTVALFPCGSAVSAREEYRMLEGKLQERGIRSVELQNWLPGKVPLFPKDNHPTTAGQALLGTAIGRAVYGSEERSVSKSP